MPTQAAAEKKSTATLRRHRVRQVLKGSLITFFKEDCLTISAAIAYFGLLSLFPLFILMVSLGGIYIRQYELSGDLTTVLQSFLPMKPDFIMRKLVEISQAFGRVSTISFLFLLWSAAGMFLPLEKALNSAWGVEEVRSWWRSYIVALEMAFLFVMFITVYSGFMGLNIYIHDEVYDWAELHWATAFIKLGYQTVFAAAAFGMALVIFTVLFQELPARHLGTRKVLPSAFLTASLWEAARTLFTHLLPLFNYSHVYGSIGGMITLMVWLYISSAVTLFGAHVSSNLYRILIAPAKALAVEPPVQSIRDAT